MRPSGRRLAGGGRARKDPRLGARHHHRVCRHRRHVAGDADEHASARDLDHDRMPSNVPGVSGGGVRSPGGGAGVRGTVRPVQVRAAREHRAANRG